MVLLLETSWPEAFFGVSVILGFMAFIIIVIWLGQREDKDN